MPVRAETVPPWSSGDHVLGKDRETPIGVVRAYGLEAVAEALARSLRKWPDLELVPCDQETIKWLLEWSRNPRTYRDFVVRDNDRENWFCFRSAWLKRFGRVEEGVVVVINGASLETEPVLGPSRGRVVLGLG